VLSGSACVKAARKMLLKLTPDYNRDNGIYLDAGIAVLEKKIQFSDYIRPICLPLHPVDSLDFLAGDLVIFTGWGLDSVSNEVSEDLKTINMQVTINLLVINN